ncbi:MAG: dockerin type I domain-containing protein [Bacilli bacterium]
MNQLLKNKNLIAIIVIVVCFMPSIKVKAATNVKGYATGNDVLFASAANLTANSCKEKVSGIWSSVYGAPGYLHCLDVGEIVYIVDTDKLIASTTASCSKGYYKVSATTSSGSTYSGYVCYDNIQVEVDTSQYATEFKDFPTSYWEDLAFLKTIHPNWTFTAYNTNIDFNTAVTAESNLGLSYIQSTDAKYLLVSDKTYDTTTSSFIQQESGGWYAANSSTIAYYMDPRNFLNEIGIFQFENLGYNSTYQTIDVVKSIFANTDLLQYAKTYIEAATFIGYDGTQNNVSPVFLAARSRLEVVKSDGKLSNSANGSGYINDIVYYNFFNIGAYSSCANPISCALQYAAGLNSEGVQVSSSFNRPWTTAEGSILNGSHLIATGYINVKQNTLYFQKFDVVNYNGNYNHQYMTNIQAPYTEGKSTWTSYKTIDGLLDQPINFVIPVYNNMGDSAYQLPTNVDQDSIDELEDANQIEENNKSIAEIITSSGYKSTGSYFTGVNLGTTAQAIIANIQSVNNNVTVTISTTTSSETKTITGSEKLGTGDIIKISNGTIDQTFRIVIAGDVNGDGTISAVDYVQIKNHIMNNGLLTGSYSQAADSNSDGSITALDYVNIKNKIMG